jgi:hypothetical protein
MLMLMLMLPKFINVIEAPYNLLLGQTTKWRPTFEGVQYLAWAKLSNSSLI